MECFIIPELGIAVDDSKSVREEVNPISQVEEQTSPGSSQPNEITAKPEPDQVPVKDIPKPEQNELKEKSDQVETKPEPDRVEFEQESGLSEVMPEPEDDLAVEVKELAPTQPVCIRFSKTPSPVSDEVISEPVKPEPLAIAGSSSGSEVIEPEPETSSKFSRDVKNSDSDSVVTTDDGETEPQSSSPGEAVNGQAEPVKCNANELIQRLDEIDPGHKLRSLCKKGDTVALEEFIKAGVDLDVVSDEGWTCLHEIITHECQFTEVARILMTHGANVNTQDLHGDSPLHSCLLYHCSKCHPCLASFLALSDL